MNVWVVCTPSPLAAEPCASPDWPLTARFGDTVKLAQAVAAMAAGEGLASPNRITWPDGLSVHG
jgi:hypothetical protein